VSSCSASHELTKRNYFREALESAERSTKDSGTENPWTSRDDDSRSRGLLLQIAVRQTPNNFLIFSPKADDS
jgi:hypothetical protein